MIYRLTETLIEYHPDDLDAWKRGEKKKWLGGRVVPPEVYNQPRYHFGEFFVLNYFEKARWHGFCFYSFDSSLEKYQEGHKKLTELFPDDRLVAFRDVRSRSSFPEGKGEPDLFLYMENGPTLFLEVKKEQDQVSPAQLEYLAQIRAILKAEIGIVYLVKHSHQHVPKTFELNLVTFRCNQDVGA